MKEELESLFVDGQFQCMDEAFEEAVATFSKILEQDSGSAKVYQGRAVAKLRLGDKIGALADLDAALGLEPENPRLHYHKGAIFIQQNALDEAVESLSRAITLDPSYVSAYMLRGQVYEKLGDDQNAAADMSRAVELRKEERKISGVVDF